MTATLRSLRLRQSAMDRRCGTPICDARLNDRARLSLVFQAASLLSHLDTARWCLMSGWSELHIGDSGLLVGAVCQEGIALKSATAQLTDLIEVVFGSRDRVIGKGPSKRIADELLQRWKRSLGSIPANRVVTDLMRAADFLWRPAYSSVRQCLVAELVDSSGTRLHVAGPGRFEQRLLALGADYSGLLETAATCHISEIWRRAEQGLTPTGAGFGRMDLAHHFYRSGRWNEAMQALEGLDSVAAGVVVANCQLHLGKLRSAKSTLTRLTSRPGISTSEAHSIIEAGVALCLQTANCGEAQGWLDRLQTGRRAMRRSRVVLLRAEIALESGDFEGLGRYLAGCRSVNQERGSSWRWSRLAAVEALHRRNPSSAEAFLVTGLLRDRRVVPKVDASEMWSLLGRIRVERGDEEGAEKAARHALRLAEGVDCAAATSASRLLLELRLRQGRTSSVEDLSIPIPRSRSGGEFVGPSVAELLARRELVLGQPYRAWRILEPVLEQPSTASSAQQQRLIGLSARALGWLGRGADARELLERVEDGTLLGLDAEEYPAIWAFAGDWQRARLEVSHGAVGVLWKRGLQGETILDEDWQALTTLGSFRGARMVLDLQILLPNTVPRSWLDWAAAGLRRVGANPFVERLDRRRQGSWQALRSYVESGPGDSDKLGDLFRSAGYFDVRLEWNDEPLRQVLVAGHGGTRELKATTKWGELVLRAESMDPALEALFALAVRDFRPEIEEGAETSTGMSGILGRSLALRRALARLECLAKSDVAVLIQGETGTGKELAARQLHLSSRRASQRLVAVNCGALSESLLLSDLFGHVRGAFTGADRDRVGIFEAAAGGTVLLDEIGDLPLAAQGKLLRVLQEGEVRRVGESLPRQVDVRVVAATHRNLESMVKERAFRSDLYYRLKVGCVRLPPLRRREGDVLLLSEHFLRGTGRSLTHRARQRLSQHDWPGNVRELRNVLEVTLALSPDRVIDAKALELPREESGKRLGYHQQVEELRRRLVQEALSASDGNRGEAARKLDLSRQALSYLVRRFGIDWT